MRSEITTTYREAGENKKRSDTDPTYGVCFCFGLPAPTERLFGNRPISHAVAALIGLNRPDCLIKAANIIRNKGDDWVVDTIRSLAMKAVNLPQHGPEAIRLLYTCLERGYLDEGLIQDFVGVLGRSNMKMAVAILGEMLSTFRDQVSEDQISRIIVLLVKMNTSQSSGILCNLLFSSNADESLRRRVFGLFLDLVQKDKDRWWSMFGHVLCDGDSYVRELGYNCVRSMSSASEDYRRALDLILKIACEISHGPLSGSQEMALRFLGEIRSELPAINLVLTAVLLTATENDELRLYVYKLLRQHSQISVDCSLYEFLLGKFKELSTVQLSSPNKEVKRKA